MDQQERIHQLEARLMDVEDLLDTLNVTVYRQQEQLSRLQRQLTEVVGRLSTGASDGHPRDGADEVPPHY
ncbi:MAG: SlyX family protein [Zoogloeaceae bacterium]|nr:SlyX family protein [Rhodocyclaceae bacterium]MCP5235908.1 SlyX family protein [Zoogloeaceae bacterium]